MDVGRALDALKKDRESLAKKERVMDQGLKVSHHTTNNNIKINTTRCWLSCMNGLCLELHDSNIWLHIPDCKAEQVWSLQQAM